jgi:tetratricopeptide (TPR) repeat protein
MRALCLVVAIAACGGRAAPARPEAPAVDVRAEIEQAETAEKARRHDVARTHYERAVAAARDPASIWFARREFAETLATWGEYPAAITHYEAALAAKPEDPIAWHDLGMLRFNQGDSAGAIAALERSRELAPKDFRPRRELGVIRWKLGDLAGAATEYKQMLALELPDRMRAMVEWAVAALAAKQRGEPMPPPPGATKP